jgi:nucleotide-binding universal stress UspA family protein
MSNLPARTTMRAHHALIRPDRREVVVGIESSGDNRVVVEWAAREAVARNAPLTLVHTWEWEGVPVWATPYHYARKKDIAREGEQILARAKTCALEAGAHDVEVVTQRGYAPEVLVAMTAQASMLVVGNRHASAVARGVFGSVSTAVVSEARCPVIVLSGESDGTEVPDVTGDGSEVVVGLTGGPHDQNLLGFGFDFAREHALTLRAVFCWDAVFGSLHLPPPDTAKRQLAENLARWCDSYPEVAADAVVRHGAPIEVLVELSDLRAMLVVGRHAPRQRFGAVLGSTTLGVVHHARCPVAVIPPSAAGSEHKSEHDAMGSATGPPRSRVPHPTRAHV